MKDQSPTLAYTARKRKTFQHYRPACSGDWGRGATPRRRQSAGPWSVSQETETWDGDTWGGLYPL